MSGPLQRRYTAKSYAIKIVNLLYDASVDLVLGYVLALVFLLGIGLAVAGDLISLPVMHPA